MADAPPLMDENGPFVLNTGRTYWGSLRNGMVDGYGVLTEADGRIVYMGDYREGLRQGHGIGFTRSGCYIGEWWNNEMSGVGVYEWPDGSHYTGEWKASKQNGRGVHVVPGEGTIEGEFRDGLPHGWGVLVLKKSGWTYEGEFVKSAKHGRGCLWDHEGNVVRKGLWVNNEPVDGSND